MTNPKVFVVLNDTAQYAGDSPVISVEGVYFNREEAEKVVKKGTVWGTLWIEESYLITDPSVCPECEKHSGNKRCAGCIIKDGIVQCTNRSSEKQPRI
jgi:hypothetical protein